MNLVLVIISQVNPEPFAITNILSKKIMQLKILKKEYLKTARYNSDGHSNVKCILSLSILYYAKPIHSIITSNLNENNRQ